MEDFPSDMNGQGASKGLRVSPFFLQLQNHQNYCSDSNDPMVKQTLSIFCQGQISGQKVCFRMVRQWTYGMQVLGMHSKAPMVQNIQLKYS